MRRALLVTTALGGPFAALAIAACGSDDAGTPTGGGDASADHAIDVHKTPDASQPDTSEADAFHAPLAAKCVRDGGAPERFVPGDAGVLDAAEADALAFPRPAQVIDFGGATVLSLPEFVGVTFSDETQRGEKLDFLDSVGCTDYWRAVASDYGVGQGVGGAHVQLTEKAPTSISDDQIQAWLAKKISAGNGFPQPKDGILYVIFYPDTTTIELQGSQSCQAFGGYHNSVSIAGKNVAYAVIPDCGSFGALTGIDAITGTTSHELIEAVTDPFPLVAPTFAAPEPDGWGAVLGPGGEVGDLCTFNQDAFFQPQGYPFYVQRSWSNSRAFAFDDPCQPAKPGPYFSVAPIFTSTITADIGYGPKPARGVTLAPGGSTVVPVVAYANGAMGSWSVQAVDVAQMRGGKPELALSLGTPSVKNGDIVNLSITRKNASPYGVSAFALISTNAGRQSFYWGMVGQ